MRTLYLLYGLTIIGLWSWAEYTGWTWDRSDELKGVPVSVRENPGSYRAFYSGRAIYLRGK